MMVQSVAGLAAKAVNEGRGDEMVWVGTDNFDIKDWFGRLTKRHPKLETRALLSPWELVDRYVKDRALVEATRLVGIAHRTGRQPGGRTTQPLARICWTVNG